MFRKFTLHIPHLILAFALMILGLASLFMLNKTQLIIAGKNFTSLALIVSGLVAYSGVLVIVTMFQSEKVLSVGLLLPSIVAVAIFVYGFIGWSIRVSLSHGRDLRPDYTWAGLKTIYAPVH